MKQAIGKYIKVKAINREDAIKLADILFEEGAEANKLWAEADKLGAEANKLRAEGNKLWAERDKLGAEANKLWAEADKLRAERDKLRAERDKLWAEANKLWAILAIKYEAFIPEGGVLNLIACDLENHVYCFVFNRKELWIYDGENCPNPETVEKIDWK